MNLGAPEILVILVVALLVFGPHKLPEIGRQVGGAMRELRKMQDSVKQELQTVMNEEQPRYDKPVSAALPTTPEAPVSTTRCRHLRRGPTRVSRGPPARSASRRRTPWRTRTATQTGR